jgi:hypothetical protein
MRGTIQKYVASLALLALAACTGAGTFGLSSDDNDPKGLASAFAAEHKPEAGKPMNGTGKAMAFLVTAQPKKLIAYDLAAGKPAWTVDAEVSSRVVVGKTFVAAREGKDKIVARSLDDGKQLWAHGLSSMNTPFEP